MVEKFCRRLVLHKKDSHTIIVLTKLATLCSLQKVILQQLDGWLHTITLLPQIFHKHFVIACSIPGKTHPPSASKSHMKPWRFGNNEHYSCDGWLFLSRTQANFYLCIYFSLCGVLLSALLYNMGRNSVVRPLFFSYIYIGEQLVIV